MERLKQKMTSSRVFASLQQVASTGVGQQQQQQQQQQQPHQQDHQVALSASSSDKAQEQSEPKILPEAAMSTAWLMAADATAHLTDEEKGILLEVFKKEEQFQRDTIKQLTASRAQQQQQRPQTNKENNQRPVHNQAATSRRSQLLNRASNQSTCSSSSTGAAHQHHRSSVSSATPPSSSTQSSRPCSCSTLTCGHGTPSRAAPSGQPSSSEPINSRAQSRNSTLSSSLDRSASAAPASNNKEPVQCRICRKILEPSEPCHLCSNCNQFICDDCASYSISDQFWMCSSCRRRAMNPAIPADALKELGLNQNSSAVRRMTLRLNQGELKMAVNKCQSDQTETSNQAKVSSSDQPTPSQQQQMKLRRQSLERRTTLGCESDEPSQRQQRRVSAQLSRQQSFGTQQQAHTERRPSQAAGQRSQRAPKSQQPAPRQAQQQASPCTSSDAISGASLMRSGASRQHAKMDVVQPMKMSDSSQQRAVDVNSQLRTQTAWHEPETKRAPPPGHQMNQRRDSLDQQLAHSQMGSPQQQWPPQATDYTTMQHFDKSEERRQLVRSMMKNHRNSLAFVNQPVVDQQQSDQMYRAEATPQNAFHMSPNSRDSSRRNSYNRNMANMSQLIPVPAEQMHLRRLSDQSNLVRRSSIIASNYFDGTMISRNRSHSNIDSVHYMQQQQRLASSRQQLIDSSSSFADSSYWQQSSMTMQGHVLFGSGHLEAAAPQPYAFCSSSATNLNFLQPDQQQRVELEHNQQRRLSDGGQYFVHDPQQIASIVTSYAQKRQTGGRREPRQSSEEVHSDSSDSDSEPAGIGQSYMPAAMDYQDESYAPQQSTITIPSVSVSEFAAAAAARRRSSIHMQQQQDRDQVMMASYQHDNQITPMQINVAIEQVIQQQQQEQLAATAAPNNQQEAQFSLLAARRGSNARILPSVPGGQSRSLLELPLNGDAQANRQADKSNEQTSGANSGSGHTRNNSTAGIGLSTLGLPCPSPTIRRASAPEGQIIKIVVDDIDSSMAYTGRHPQNGMKHHKFDQHIQAGNFYERHILYRDESLDPNGNHVGRCFGLQVMGGKLDTEGNLQACVKWVLRGGPADKVGIRPGDKLIEWDGKCLIDMSYEQVAEIIESSANIAEVLVKPKPQQHQYDPEQPPANYVRSQRRLSQQTERDLRRQHQGARSSQPLERERRMSCAVQPAGGAMSERGRPGTGRRLPQIPPGTQPIAPSSGKLGVSVPIRHASTGQLDLNPQPGANILAANQQNHLGLYNQDQAQHQSRSASELHRGSVANLSQVRGSFSKSNETSLGNMLNPSMNGAWIQPQQYGGSQQMVSNSGHFGPNSGDGFALGPAFNETSGLIGLQVSVDERMATLEVSVLSAHEIVRDPNLDYVVKVRILPENNRFKVCTTQPSQDMNWKETFIFQNFPISQVQRMALEIGIWVYEEAPRLSAHTAQPVCEALIPIQSARERNIDFWPLRPPPTSPQIRRKSLNDLISDHYCQNGIDQSQRMLANHKLRSLIRPSQGSESPPGLKSTDNDKRVGSFGSLVRVSSVGLNDVSNMANSQRERSSSIRNLPDMSRSQMQPRRASDEVATSSSHRLIARLSPAVSRRSISVMNVGDGYSGGRTNRSPASRLGSQANILKAVQARRDSSRIQ